MYPDKLNMNRFELTPEIEARIVNFMKRYTKDYVYCGEIAVFMHNNLEWTNQVLEELEFRGVVHKMTDVEKKQNSIDKRACVFTLPSRK